MMRHITAVLLSALIGTIFGTLIWIGLAGTSPLRILIGLAEMTLMFTIPGSCLLMAVTFNLTNRGLSPFEAARLVIPMGTIVGAVMLLPFGDGLYFAGLDAIYGCLTIVAFVCLLSLLKAYPANSY